MNKLTQIFLVLFMICLPVTLWADNDKDDDDSRYLAGAVPEVDGRVVFSREFSIPGMSQDEIYERMLKWLDGRMAQNKNNSRVVYKEKGVIAAAGEEWLVFSSTALSLDRTWLTYQVTVNCQPQKCTMEVEKIRYTYREKEKYAAEEWITDKYALNKAKTKMVRGLAKWRRKTVNFADNLFEEAAKALSQKPMEAKAEATPKNFGKSCCIQYPFSRPALRTVGESRNIQHTLLSYRTKRTVRHTGMSETTGPDTYGRTAQNLCR